MRLTLGKLVLALALIGVLTVATHRASAQCYSPAPAVAYYAPPAVSYYAPPAVSYYAAPAPVASYYYAPAPAVSYYAAPAVSYYAAPAPVVSYYAAPVYGPTAVTSTYRYGLFGRRQASYTYYYP